MSEPRALSIVHQDDAIVVLDKPAGICVIPARIGDPRDCLRHLVEEHLGSKVFVVHRIDRETSGLVVMARTADAHRALNDAFSGRSVAKTYRAFVAGGPRGDAGVIDMALAPGRKGRMRPARSGEEGLAASTRWRVLERFRLPSQPEPVAALIAFEPATGRQHQIRVHARALECPILGDRLYAPREVRDRAPRLMLHASGLRFRHPTSRVDVGFTAPDPIDFDAMRQRLATR